MEMFCERQRHYNASLFSCRIIVIPILLFFFLAGAYVKLFDIV